MDFKMLTTVALLLVISTAAAKGPQVAQYDEEKPSTFNVFDDESNAIFLDLNVMHPDPFNGTRKIENLHTDYEYDYSPYPDVSLYLQGTKKRERRQIPQAVQYFGPIISDLSATQHCQGIYLRWKRPPAPISFNNPYTISEFQYYNVYRSSRYFTSVQGLKPYATGKDTFELKDLPTVYWIDKDPITNDNVWYAITIVTRDGKEVKDVTPAKAMYIGAFGGSGIRLPLTPNVIKGKTINHASMYNSVRNEYFVAWDVDTNNDRYPDRIYALKLSPTGLILGNILDASANLPQGVQGWPSVTYNPLTNEYLITFQLKTPKLFSGKYFIVGQRVRATSLNRASNPSVLLNANENRGGRRIQTSVMNPRVIYNPINHGFILLAETIGLDARHSIALQFSDSQTKGIKAMKLFDSDARSGRIYYDTKRNELYVVAQVPNKAINKQGQVVPKLAYSIIVTKRNATGGLLQAAPVFVQGGETNILDASISGFYDIQRDRLMLFWSDIVNAKRIIKSSRVVLDATVRSVVEFMGKHEEHVCPTPMSVQLPFAAPLPTTGGQILVWEHYLSGRYKLGSSLANQQAFQFQGRSQKKPIVVTNEKNDQVLVTWLEIINGKQVNLFGRILKAVTHRCVSCSAPKVCKRENVCVLPNKAKNPCSINNGGCSQICLTSYNGAKCSCRKQFKLSPDKKTCVSVGRSSVSYTILAASLKTIWKAAVMQDGSLKIDRLPFNGASIVAIHLDEKRDLLYWSDVDNSVIWRSKMDGTNKEIFMRNVRADGIVADADTGKVFWTDFLNKRIEVADSNKQNKRVLVSIGVDKPRAIAMCKLAGTTYVYWTDWGSQTKVERIQLDGSLSSVTNRRVIVSYGLGWPNGLAIECDKKLLYWADAQFDKIEVSDLLGSNRRSLAGASVQHPYSLAVFENSVFWSDWDGTVLKADKGSGLNKEVLLSTIARPTGLYIIKGKVLSTKSCNDPGVPRNGYRTGNDFKEDSIVTFECNKNYEVVGESQIRCQSNGEWTGRLPICIETRCQDPPIPLDGNRVVTGSSVGEGVIYTCNPGYKLIGNKVRKCLPGGEWDGKQPRCMGPPVIKQAPQSQTIGIGKAAILKCKASGDGELKIKWLKDGKPFTVKSTDRRIFEFQTSIFIQDVRYSDSGLFTCQVSNEAGIISAEARLRVLGKKIPECGNAKFTTRQRIAGGQISGAGSHPWIAMLWNKKTRKVFCGGSLIAEKWVLTAAHCFQSVLSLNDIEIKFGKTRARKKEPNEQTRRIKKLFKHPRFSDATYDSDVALIELESAVTITDYVIPICLPYDDSDFDMLKVGAQAVIAGWGSKDKSREDIGVYSKRLREVRIPVADQRDCQSKMKYPVTANMFCAGDGADGDACKGDSGGPLVIQNAKTKKHVLLGIVSWGESCGKKDAFGVYVKLYNFLDWVNSIAQ